MEEEAAALRDMQAKVEKEMSAVQGMYDRNLNVQITAWSVDTNCVTAVELEELVAKTSEASAHFEMNSQLSFQSTLEWILGLWTAMHGWEKSQDYTLPMQIQQVQQQHWQIKRRQMLVLFLLAMYFFHPSQLKQR